ncbi:peptidoglycan DD-metalloendopeptidase family protein [Tenacibaculum amylolyticum]|uniref:peptidoglycan DD-metalloendopeptidase family protein n=1 Tax=Tenacibaculum amylolyticum TaxID=104269 RepID=UPI0038940D18
MKTITNLLVLAVYLCVYILPAQELVFTKNGRPLTKSFSSKTKEKVFEKQNKHHELLPKTLDNVVLTEKEISDKEIVSESFDFFQGLQSPYDPNLWVYLEREQIGNGYRFKTINTVLNEEKILIQKNSQEKQSLAYKPIGWTNHIDEIFVEALFLDAAEQHEGIFILNLKTKELRKIPITFSYVRTPLLSPDRKQFLFTGTLDEKVDFLHGHTDVLYKYSLSSKTALVVTQSKGAHMHVFGWKEQLEQKTIKENRIQRSSLSYYLPWDFGDENCVSRHGTPGPTSGHSPVGRCNLFGNGGHHGYSAIDFATSLSRDDNVRASAAGVVSFAGISGSLTSGYGRLVIIRHSDGTRTYYAHNKSISVRQGQNVQKGQIIAKEGTTGGSSGDHIHFEWRAAGGNASTPGSFVDAGQPRQNYIYRSQNSFGTSADTQAPTTSISASGGNTQSGDFTVNFNDRDNVNVTQRFYQALEQYGNNWYANRGNGFFNDNFNVFYSGYTQNAGSWSISNGRLRQSNTAVDNTRLNTFLSQNSGLPYLYEFAAKVESTSGPRKFGIHIMADDVTQDQRGNSYLIWFSGEDNKIRIYETINNTLNFRAIGNVSQDNNWANYKITYSPAYGVIEVFKNNRSILKWTDTTPIQRGSSISLRTNRTNILFDDLKVYKYRAGSTQRITAGTGVNKDIRRRNGKVKSLVKDVAGNWSSSGNLDVTISSLSSRNFETPEALLNDAVKVFPNPTKDRMFINFPSQIKETTTISIVDITGRTLKVIKKISKEKETQQVDLSNAIKALPQGHYLLKILNKQVSKTIKFIKN